MMTMKVATRNEDKNARKSVRFAANLDENSTNNSSTISRNINNTTNNNNNNINTTATATNNNNKCRINQTIYTNTFKVGEYCKKCGSFRIGPLIELGCKNCEIPTPENNLSKSSKSDFMSRSFERLNRPVQQIDIENQIPEILNNIKMPPEGADGNCKQLRIPIKPRTNLPSNKSTWKCYSCNVSLNPGEIAIYAEKVDKNFRWHPACFACTICKQQLSDLLYFNVGNDIYCEKHFDEILSWRKCAACEEAIKTNEYVCAENNYWHIEHFVCWNCECSLAGQKYIVVDSLPYCIQCHERIFPKICQTCEKKISPDQVRLTYEKLNWHSDEDCFKCSTCNVDLLESHFLLKNNKLFCSLDCKKKLIKN